MYKRSKIKRRIIGKDCWWEGFTNQITHCKYKCHGINVLKILNDIKKLCYRLAYTLIYDYASYIQYQFRKCMLFIKQNNYFHAIWVSHMVLIYLVPFVSYSYVGICSTTSISYTIIFKQFWDKKKNKFTFKFRTFDTNININSRTKKNVFFINIYFLCFKK